MAISKIINEGIGNLTANISFDNGSGIDFSASEGSGASSSVLDDYEVGTWTASAGTGTVNSQGLGYVKIGKQVTLFGVLTTFSDRTSNASIDISGLPFTSASDNYAAGATFHRFVNAGGDSISAYISINTTSMNFYVSINNASYDSVKHDDLTSTSSNFFFTISYRAA